MAIDPQAIDRLIALGRRQGFVTTGQIDLEMPVDRMSEVEIAEIVDRLERAGVSVELDEALTMPGGRNGAQATPSRPLTVLHLPEDPPAGPVPARPAGKPDAGPAGRLSVPQGPAAGEGGLEEGKGGKASGGKPLYVLPAIAAVAVLVLVAVLFVF
jgi:Sigma-70 factor, region 1.1